MSFLQLEGILDVYLIDKEALHGLHDLCELVLVKLLLEELGGLVFFDRFLNLVVQFCHFAFKNSFRIHNRFNLTLQCFMEQTDIFESSTYFLKFSCLIKERIELLLSFGLDFGQIFGKAFFEFGRTVRPFLGIGSLLFYFFDLLGNLLLEVVDKLLL